MQDDAEADNTRLLKEIKSLINSLMETPKVQKNVNYVNIGLPTLKHHLAEFLMCQEIKAQAKAKEQEDIDRTSFER